MLAGMEQAPFTIETSAAGVSHLQLCRPERLNTLDPAFFPALRDAVTTLNAAGRTRALVIMSAGGGGQLVVLHRDEVESRM